MSERAFLNSMGVALAICGGALVVFGSALITSLPEVPTATFPVGFTLAHFQATGWMLIGAISLAVSAVITR